MSHSNNFRVLNAEIGKILRIWFSLDCPPPQGSLKQSRAEWVVEVATRLTFSNPKNATFMTFKHYMDIDDISITLYKGMCIILEPTKKFFKIKLSTSMQHS